MFLLNVLLVPYIFSLFAKSFFVCPECKHIQSDNYTLLSEDSHTSLDHGRRTKSGRLDKRYNSVFSTTTLSTIGVECNKCRCTYKNMYVVEG
jgi:protein-arginine kinase activator protein McsA